jgi:hypothetical protein
MKYDELEEDVELAVDVAAVVLPVLDAFRCLLLTPPVFLGRLGATILIYPESHAGDYCGNDRATQYGPCRLVSLLMMRSMVLLLSQNTRKIDGRQSDACSRHPAS